MIHNDTGVGYWRSFPCKKFWSEKFKSREEENLVYVPTWTLLWINPQICVKNTRVRIKNDSALKGIRIDYFNCLCGS